MLCCGIIRKFSFKQWALTNSAQNAAYMNPAINKVLEVKINTLKIRSGCAFCKVL